MFEPTRQPDPMMDELHAARRRIHEKTKHLSGEELEQWYHERAVQTAAEMGYDLVPSTTHPRAYRMVKRTAPP